MLFFFHLRFLSRGCIFFLEQPLLVTRVNLTVFWINSDYSKAIAFFFKIIYTVTYIPHPLNTDGRCQRGKNQRKWKDHQK